MAKIKNEGERRGPKLEVVKPKTANQELAVNFFRTKTLTILEGIAGTGKTYLSINYALQQFFSGKVSKILLTRPLVNVANEQIGFLPGEINEKTKPYSDQFNEYMNEFLPQLGLSDEKRLQNDVEFVPLAYLRGRNFHNTIIIADEMQNSTSLQVKTLLTRVAENTQIILLGDTKQSDRPTREVNGLTDLVNKLKERPLESSGVVKFTSEDILRSGFVREILELYGDI